MTAIEDIIIRKILDSRGNATVEADVITEFGFGRASAPSGASTGTHEAVVANPDTAIEFAYSEVIPELLGCDAGDQEWVDSILRSVDGTDNFSRIGGNMSVALSLASAKAAADEQGIELFRYLGGALACRTPFPLGNMIGGGAHAPYATDIQEFLVVPTGANTAEEGVFANASVHKTIKKLLTDRNKACGKGDEGAWAPSIKDAEAFEIVSSAVNKVSDETGIEIRMGLDIAASELFDGSQYCYSDIKRTPEEQVSYMAELCDEFNLCYIEDPFDEEDFDSFGALTNEIGDRCIVCGDDLFVTNRERIKTGIEKDAANCVLIKPNQIGTLTDTYEAIRMAHQNGMKTVMSHRSGETTDTTIAHLGTAFGCIFLKTGAVGGERIAKLNELIRIEEMI